MITTVQNAFAQENFIVNSTTKKLKSQLIAKMGEKEEKKSSTENPVSNESKSQVTDHDRLAFRNRFFS